MEPGRRFLNRTNVNHRDTAYSLILEIHILFTNLIVTKQNESSQKQESRSCAYYVCGIKVFVRHPP
jgi:hypothetical protein